MELLCDEELSFETFDLSEYNTSAISHGSSSISCYDSTSETVTSQRKSFVWTLYARVVFTIVAHQIGLLVVTPKQICRYFDQFQEKPTLSQIGSHLQKHRTKFQEYLKQLNGRSFDQLSCPLIEFRIYHKLLRQSLSKKSLDSQIMELISKYN